MPNSKSAQAPEAFLPRGRTPGASGWERAPSLRTRFIVLFSLVFLACTGTILLFVVHQQQDTLDRVMHDQAASVAASIARLAHDEVAANDRVALSGRLETFNQINSIRSMAITDRQGSALAAVRRNAAGNMTATASSEIDFVDGPSGDTQPPWTLFSNDAPRIAWVPIGEIAPIGWVRLEYETSAAADARGSILITGLVLVAGMALLGGLLASAAVAAPLRSLRRASTYAQSIGQLVPEEGMPTLVSSSETMELRTLGRSLIGTHKAVEALRSACLSNQAQLRALFDVSNEPIVETDAEMRILHANPAWMTLQSPPCETGDSIIPLLAEGEAEQLLPPLHALVRGTQRSIAATVRLCTRPGDSECWLELNAYRILDQQGQFRSVIWHGLPRDARGQRLSIALPADDGV